MSSVRRVACRRGRGVQESGCPPVECAKGWLVDRTRRLGMRRILCIGALALGGCYVETQPVPPPPPAMVTTAPPPAYVEPPPPTYVEQQPVPVAPPAQVDVDDYGIAVGPPPPVYYDAPPPPPPRWEPRPVAPFYGAVWIDGYWDWRGGSWFWTSGRYVSARDGYVYAPPRYDYVGGRVTVVRPHWKTVGAPPAYGGRPVAPPAYGGGRV